MASITGTSVFLVVTTLLPVLIPIAASTPMVAVQARAPCNVTPPELQNGGYVELKEARLALYHCHELFFLEGPQRLKCVTSADGNDTWVPDQEHWEEFEDRPECHPFKDCQSPQIFRGDYEGDCCAPKDEVEFYCHDEERYTLSGAASATCLPNGTWSEPLPVCQDTYCRDPGHSPDGERTMVLDRKVYKKECCPPDVAVYYNCHEGYELVGKQIIRCGANATWDHARPKCKPMGACDDFEVAHGRITGERSGGDFFAPGDSAFVECDPGFRVNGTDQLFCEDDGVWDEPVPTCVEYNCTRFIPGPQLIVEEFENSNVTTFPQDYSINFKCKYGYLLQGVHSTTCRDGGWFGRMPKCEQITCGTLRAPPNGWMIAANSTAIGSKASFGCFQGYALMGSRERQCQDYGEWSGSPVRCVPLAMYTDRRRTSCLDPGTPDNGVLVGRSRFMIGSEVEFACNPGYHLRGNATIRCLANGRWSARPPLCLGKFYFDDERNVEEALGENLDEDVQLPHSQRNDSNEARARALILNSPNTRHYVYFLFDASNSIGERNFRHGIKLAKAITRKVTVSVDGNRIGAIVFAREAKEVIQLSECRSTEDALEKLDKIKYLNGSGTSIKAGITALKTSIDTVWADLQGIHKSVNFSVFLITDGKANIGGSVSKVTIRQKKVETYCIGITGSTHLPTLEKLASEPAETYVFVLRNYDALQWLAEKLTNGTIDYGICGISNKHRRDTGLDDDNEPRPRILGGQRVVHSWPWMVEISLVKSPEKVSCGGTVIAQKWILTAAHCMFSDNKQPLSPSDIRVRAGLITSRGNAKRTASVRELHTPKELAVDAFILHNDYNNTAATPFFNDIALLRLKKKITYEQFIRPICLPPAKGDIPRESTFYNASEPAVVIGWGSEKKNGNSADQLKQLMKNIGSDEDCRKTGKGNYTSQGMMCAKSETGDACGGDSGGPLMQGVETDDTVWTQVGIVSWGVGCRQNRYAFYTDVSYYVPWIRSHINADAAAEAAVPGNEAARALVEQGPQQ